MSKNTENFISAHELAIRLLRGPDLPVVFPRRGDGPDAFGSTAYPVMLMLEEVEGESIVLLRAEHPQHRAARPPVKDVLYLVIVEGDVEPRIIGTFATDAERLAAAKEHRLADMDMQDGLYCLDLTPKGPEMFPFSGGELGE